MAPRILISSIVLGAEYSSYVIFIETHALTFLTLNILYKGTVRRMWFVFEKQLHTVFPHIVALETIPFLKWNMWKFLYSFCIMVIFYLIN